MNEPPFFPDTPPPWAAQALARVVLGVALAALGLSIAIEVPETVRGPFVLEGGERSIAAPVDGEVVDLPAPRGASVAVGAPLARVGAAVVTAPCAGVVAALDALPGDIVARGARLGRLVCERAPVEARMRIPAAASGRVRPGQRAWLLVDAWPHAQHGAWAGEVRAVWPTEGEAEVVLTVEAGDKPLIAGMTGVARVRLGARRPISLVVAPFADAVAELR